MREPMHYSEATMADVPALLTLLTSEVQGLRRDLAVTQSAVSRGANDGRRMGRGKR